VPCLSDPSPPGAQLAVKTRRSTAYPFGRRGVSGETGGTETTQSWLSTAGSRSWWANRADSHSQEPHLLDDQIQLEDEDWKLAVDDISLLLPEDLEEVPGDPVEGGPPEAWMVVP